MRTTSKSPDRSRWFAMAVGLVLIGGLTSTSPAIGGEITLYDGSLGTAPSQQGWFFRSFPPVPPISEQVGGGVTTIDTTASLTSMAGFFTTDPLDTTKVHPDMPVLNRTLGYTVQFDLRVDSEDHGTRVDRAGVSLIALGSDLKGIELGFWTNEVWAQSDQPLFTHAEGAAFDTTGMTHYALSVLGASYTLSANGSEILTGSLRDYSAFGPPYSTANQLVISDDTTSASARFDLAWVSVNVVPEPSSIWLLSMGALSGLLAARRRLGFLSRAATSPPRPTSL